MAKQSKRDFWLQAVAEQRQWIADHGGDEMGYVERYGSKDDPDKFGDGGEAIYKADTDALADMEYSLGSVRSPRR